MGIAVIIPSVSFADKNIGRVTLAEQVLLESLSIVGPSSVAGTTDAAEYTVDYNPIETSQRGVVWSVESGGAYATIDADTGVLTILSAASSAQSVTIRATSTENPTIYDEKTISVLYHTALVDRTDYILLSASGFYETTGIIIPVGGKVLAYFSPSVLYQMAVLGYALNSASTDDYIIIGLNKIGTVFNIYGALQGKTFASSDAPIANTKYLVEMSGGEISCSPSVGNFTEGTVTYNENKAIGIGAQWNGTSSFKKFQGKLYGVEIYDENNALIHCLLPQPDTSLLDTMTGTSYSLNGSGTYGTD